MSAKGLQDGLGNIYTTTYSYGDGYVYVAPMGCGIPEGERDYAEFLGYDTVTEEVKAPNSMTTVRWTKYYFHQKQGSGTGTTPDDRKGKVYKQETRPTADGTLLEQKDWLYRVTADASTANKAFVHLDVVTTTRGSDKAQTDYFYDTDRQGNGQYGNWTRRVDILGAGSNPSTYRTTIRSFYPQTSTGYLVDRVAEEQVTDASGNCASLTRYYYDGRDSYTTPPTKGDLTKVRKARTFSSGCTPSSWVTAGMWGYDTAGNLTQIIQVRNGTLYTTTLQYDILYRVYPMTVTNPLNHVTYRAYDVVQGWIVKETDPNGAVTEYEYDPFGRIKQVWRPGETKGVHTATEVYTYTDTTVPFRVQHSVREDLGGADSVSWLRRWEFYDGLGRLVQTQAEADNEATVLAHQRYDAFGQVCQASIPYTATLGANQGTYQAPSWGTLTTTQTLRDALGRTQIVTNTDGTTVRWSYAGWTATRVDENNHQKEYLYDVFGRLKMVKEYTGTAPSATLYATTLYTYTVLDLLSGVRDNAGNVTTITYDGLGRKTSLQDPDMGQWYYTYDEGGNLLTQVDARARAVCFTYDALDRLTAKRYDDDVPSPATYDRDDCPTGAANVTYTYDQTDQGNYGKGRRTRMDDATGYTTWTYDARGRVITELKAIDGNTFTTTTTWTYDALDRVRTMTYPGGEVVNTSYNEQGLPKRLWGTNTYTNTYVVASPAPVYDGLGRVLFLKLGNELESRFLFYGDDLRLQEIRTGTSQNPSGRQRLLYWYDDVGNVTRIENRQAGPTTEVQTFTYDPLDRLQSASVSGGNGTPYSEAYAYNTLGNLIQVNTNIYTYSQSMPHAVIATNGREYTYDANGNMTQRGGDRLLWDGENRLISMTVGGVTTLFFYDGDGVRVKKVVGGTTTYYVGNWYEETGSGKTWYYYHGGRLVALRRSGYGTDNGLYFVHLDHLGSVMLATNHPTGTVVSEQRFYAWGAVRDTLTGPPKTEYNFTGQRLDTSTGFLYYGARYYDPALQRWVQGDPVVPDPGNPQDLNRYAYVRDNPLRYTDPTGHWTFEEEPDTPGRFYPATRHTPAFRKVGYDVQSDRQATTGEALAIVTMPFWGAGAALGSVALGEVAAPVVLSPGFLLRGSVGGAGGLAGDLLGWWLAHGSLEGYDWPRALGVFVPNFFGGGLLGEVYPALPGSGQRVAAAALGNVVVGAAQRGLVGEPNSTEAVAVDAAYGVGGVFADRFFAATLRRYSGLGGASIEAISSFVSHPSMLSALHQGVLRFTGWVASHSPATSGEVWLP